MSNWCNEPTYFTIALFCTAADALNDDKSLNCQTIIIVKRGYRIATHQKYIDSNHFLADSFYAVQLHHSYTQRPKSRSEVKYSLRFGSQFTMTTRAIVILIAIWSVVSNFFLCIFFFIRVIFLLMHLQLNCSDTCELCSSWTWVEETKTFICYLNTEYAKLYVILSL